MNIYRFPPVSTELVAGATVSATEDLSSSLSSGLFRGLPSNEPVHVLVRIYVVKVWLDAPLSAQSLIFTVKCSVSSQARTHVIQVENRQLNATFCLKPQTVRPSSAECSNFGMNPILAETRMMGLPYGEETMIVGQTTWIQSTSCDRQTDGRTDTPFCFYDAVLGHIALPDIQWRI